MFIKKLKSESRKFYTSYLYYNNYLDVSFTHFFSSPDSSTAQRIALAGLISRINRQVFLRSVCENILISKTYDTLPATAPPKTFSRFHFCSFSTEFIACLYEPVLFQEENKQHMLHITFRRHLWHCTHSKPNLALYIVCISQCLFTLYTL